MGKCVSPFFGHFRKFLLILAAFFVVLGGIFALQVVRGEGVYAEENNPLDDIYEGTGVCNALDDPDCDEENNRGGAEETNPLDGVDDGSGGCNPMDDPDCAYTEETDSGNCYDAIEGLGWAVCPAVETLARASDSLMGIIKEFFATKPLIGDDTSAIFVIWRTIRDFANIIFIILFLLVIYSQLTGRMFDAYNIKKILPRLVVVAILMNLSFYICAIAVDLSNIVGAQLGGLFESAKETAIAAGAVNREVNWTDAVGWITGAGAVTAGISMAVFSASGLVYMAIAFLLGAALAVLAAFVVLAARQAIIVVLVAVSPIAFALYLLPNTEKLFGKWARLFSQMLLLFPIFAALFGGAALAGWVIQAAATDVVGVMLGLAVQAIPLIAAPFLLKNTGTILDKVNDWARRPFNPFMERARGWASENQQIRRQNMLTNTSKLRGVPTRVAQFLERNRAMRQEHLQQGESNVASRNALYVQGKQQKMNYKYDWVQRNVGTENSPIWQWQKERIATPGKEFNKLNLSEILDYEAETDKLRLDEKLRGNGKDFLGFADGKGGYTALSDGKLYRTGSRTSARTRRMVGLQQRKGDIWAAENDLKYGKWNNDRQDIEDAYYDMWELDNSRRPGDERYDEWMKRSQVFGGIRGVRGMEMAITLANREKIKVDKEAGELTAKILGKTVKKTKDVKEWLLGYRLNNSKDPIFDANGNTIPVSDWLERYDDRGNLKFRVHIADKPAVAQVLAEYMQVGDPDLIDILTQAGLGPDGKPGRLNHIKADLEFNIPAFKLKEHIGGLSSLLATNVGNSLINNYGKLNTNMMFSFSKTEKAANFVSGDADGIKIWKKILGFYDANNPVDAYKYTITLDDIKNTSEPNGPRIFYDEATGQVLPEKYNKLVLKDIFDIASSFHLHKVSGMTKEKIKPDTIKELTTFYKDDLKAEFDRVLDNYEYNPDTGVLMDRLTNHMVTLEDLTTSKANPYALRRKTDANGNAMKFRREL